MKAYRIGDYAKYMGVTPDFLKHYEDLGILSPSRSESGYRYYPFNTAMLLFECIRLRNFGLTLREMREILTAHQMENAAVEQRFSENVGHMEEEILLDQALIEEYRGFLDWKQSLENRDSDWEIRWSRPMMFLPHTDKYDFLEDSRIYEILKSWMSYIPMVKSSMKKEPDGRITWGLIVSEEMLSRLHLPVNDVVERIAPHKVFYYKFRSSIMHSSEEHADSSVHPAFQALRSLNLRCSSTYYRTTLMPADWQQDISRQYGYYAIPIDSQTL